LGVWITHSTSSGSHKGGNFTMNLELIDSLSDQIGANGLPYTIPIHPNLVHLTLGLFIMGIAF
jgi:Predicted membrane protein